MKKYYVSTIDDLVFWTENNKTYEYNNLRKRRKRRIINTSIRIIKTVLYTIEIKAKSPQEALIIARLLE